MTATCLNLIAASAYVYFVSYNSFLFFITLLLFESGFFAGFPLLIRFLIDSSYKRVHSSTYRKILRKMGNDLSKKNSSTTSSSVIENLPDELLLKIFSYVPQDDFGNVRLVSRRFYTISNDSSLWEDVSFTTYSESYLDKCRI